MEKIKILVSKMQWLPILFTLGVLRVVVDSKVEIAHSLVFIALTSLMGLKFYLDSKKTKPLDEEVRKELNEVKSMISNVAVKNGLKAKPETMRFF